MKNKVIKLLLAGFMLTGLPSLAMDTTNSDDSVAVMMTDPTQATEEDMRELITQAENAIADVETGGPIQKEAPAISKKDRFIATAYCYAQSFLGGLLPGAVGFLKPAFMQTRLYALVAHKKKDATAAALAAETNDAGSLERVKKTVNALGAIIDSWKDKYPEFHIWFSQTVKHGACVTVGNLGFYAIATALGLPKEYCVVLILYCQLAFYQGMLEKAQKKMIKRAVYNVLGLNSKHDAESDTSAEQPASPKGKKEKKKKKK